VSTLASTSPANPASTSGPLYLYGIISASDSLPAGLLGLADAPVATLANGPAAAIISPAPPGRLRPERRHLAGHQRVLQAVARCCSLLPMAFGVVAPSRPAVERLLTDHTDSLIPELDRIRDRVEMTVRLALGPEHAVRAYVEADPELKHLAARIAKGDVSHDTKMQAGRRFEAVLNEHRSRAADLLTAAIEPLDADLRPGPLRTERDLANLAVLIRRDRLDQFEQAIHAVADAFDDRHALDFSGPWPAFSFVDVKLSLEDPDSAED
jgi:hypothetical protein